VDRIFNDSFFSSPFRSFWGTSYSGNGNGSSRVGLALDVYETASDFVIIAAVPGLGPDDIKVTVTENTVTLAGQLPNVAQSEDAKGATWYLHELPYGAFQRSITLPVDIDTEKADATFHNGILNLRLPKAGHAQPRQIPIRQAQHAPADSTSLPESGASQPSEAEPVGSPS
jgi:HSP20 family protein